MTVPAADRVTYVVGIPTTINEMLADEIIAGTVPRYRPDRDAVEELCPLCYRMIWLTPSQKSDLTNLTLETMLACAVCWNRMHRTATYSALIGRTRGHTATAPSLVPQMRRPGEPLHPQGGGSPGGPGDEVPGVPTGAPGRVRNL